MIQTDIGLLIFNIFGFQKVLKIMIKENDFTCLVYCKKNIQKLNIIMLHFLKNILGQDVKNL